MQGLSSYNSFDFRDFMICLDQTEKIVNKHDLDNNCYFCTVSFIKYKSTDELANEVELMQEEGASLDSIKELFRLANINYEFSGMIHVSYFEDAFTKLNNNVEFGFVFTRFDSSGHMIFGSKKESVVNFYDSQSREFFDHNEIINYVRNQNINTFGLFVVSK